MGYKVDLHERNFGRLKVISFTGNNPKSGNARWLCRCICGNEKTIDARFLLSGESSSCGCLHKEKFTRLCKEGQKLVHNDPRYKTWAGIKQRCTNPKNPNYHDYGGRGIKVCDRWFTSFKHFCEDMGEKPSLQHSIDRIDNDGDYEPDNCRWTTSDVQIRNRRVMNKSNANFTGVYWEEKRQRYSAKIGHNGKLIALGYFVNFEDAKKARLTAERKYWDMEER